MLLEKTQHDWVTLEDARHAAALDGQGDHLGDQHLARPRARSLRVEWDAA